MRPQDIAVLLKITTKEGKDWLNKDLAHELYLSQSEISESINRSKIAGLLNSTGDNVHKQSLLEFVQYGLHYVFPAVAEAPTRGIATAHSHPLLKKTFKGNEIYVWADIDGKEYGLSIPPLYKDAAKAARYDEEFYTLLALIDVLRIGKAREINFSLQLLKQKILV